MRVGWVTYNSEEACQEVLKKINNTTITPDNTVLFLQEYTTARYAYPTPQTVPITTSYNRIKKDLENIQLLTKVLDEHRGIDRNVLLGTVTPKSGKTEEPNGDPVLSDEENGSGFVDIQLRNLQDKISKISEKELLDLLIWYLSRVHSFCYYSCQAYPSYDHLLLQGGVTRRASKNKISSEDTMNWTRDFDNKIKLKITEISQQRKVVTGDMAITKALDDFYKDKIEQEDEERFRCELCSKMFKASIFVKKHIETKHADPVVNAIKRKALETQYYNNYINDPTRFFPFLPLFFSKTTDSIKKKC